MKVAGMSIDLPDNWQWSKCNDVIDVRDGTHDTPKYTQFGYPLITSKNLKPEGIDFSDISYISEKDHQEISRRSKVDKNDILFAMIGTIGNPVIVKTDEEFSVKNVALFKFANSSVDPAFFKYLLGTPFIHRQLTNETRGGTQKFVSLTVLRNMLIPLPPIEEQKRIAAILDKADRVRRKRQEAIRLTEELGRSIFLDMFGDPVTNPKGWEKVPLSKIVKGDIRNGLSPSNKGSYHGNVLTLAAVTQGFFRNSEYKSGMFDVEPPENKKVHRSDFLVCRGNGNINLVGRACFPDQSYQDILFPDTIIGVPVDLSIIDRSFLQSMWNSPLVRRQIEKQACTTNGTLKINQTTLKNIEILLPPFYLQSKFREAFEAIDSIKTKFSSSIAENLFNSLLQRAFRGEL